MPEQALTNVLRSANVPLITPEEDQAQILARQSWLGALGANVPLVTPDENDEQNSQIVGALRASSDGAAGNAAAVDANEDGPAQTGNVQKNLGQHLQDVQDAIAWNGLMRDRHPDSPAFAPNAVIRLLRRK